MTEPYYSDNRITVLHGDCLQVMAELADASVDAVVTDPPYSLSFMSAQWDSHVSPLAFQAWCQQWATQCLRILKSGGHLLAFGGTRTWHRLTCAIEDAGFEIRDSIAWLYGSGFPKSLDVSKAIDKAAPRAGLFAPFAAYYRERREALGLTHREICEVVGAYGEHNKGGASVNWEKGYGVPTPSQWDRVARVLQMPHDMWSPLIDRAEAERQVTGRHAAGLLTGAAGLTADGDGKDRRDAPATDAARQWQGWGTALKPAHEPIVVARKPLTGTVSQTVLQHGTGALNIDACRIEGAVPSTTGTGFSTQKFAGQVGRGEPTMRGVGWSPQTGGRWPANVVLDETQAAALDQMSGERPSGGGQKQTESDWWEGGKFATSDKIYAPDTGGASRFFYTAKADSGERITHNDTAHPTVKPLSLMRWLVRLVTPPVNSEGKPGLILEPFAGSGTTVEAALLEGFRCVAIEREADYLPLITQRIHRRRDPIAYLTQGGHDLGLFELDEPPNPYSEPAEHAPDCHYEDEPCTDWCAWEGGRDVARYGGKWPA